MASNWNNSANSANSANNSAAVATKSGMVEDTVSLPARQYNDDADDAASLSSFTRAAREVARAAEGRENGSRRQQAGDGPKSANGRYTGSTTDSTAAERLMKLVQELSTTKLQQQQQRQPDAPSVASREYNGGIGIGAAAAAGYLPRQYTNNNNNSNNNSRGGGGGDVDAASYAYSGGSSTISSGSRNIILQQHQQRRLNSSSSSSSNYNNNNNNTATTYRGGDIISPPPLIGGTIINGGGIMRQPSSSSSSSSTTSIAANGEISGSTEPTGFVMPPNDNESIYYGDAGRGGGGGSSSSGSNNNGSAVIPNIYVVSASPSIVSGMSYGGGGGGNNSNPGGDVATIEMISSNSNNNNANSYNNGGHGSHHHSSSSSSAGGGGGISGNSSSASSSAYSQSQLYVGNPYMMMNNEPGGYNVNAMMHYGNNGGGTGTEAYSIAGSSAFGGGGGGLGSGMMSRSGSQSGRSLANSAALVPRAKFSWASESVGPQSTIFSRKSYGYTGIIGEDGDGGGNSVPEPNHDREGSKVVAGRIWASFAWIITFPIPNKCVMRPTKDAKQAWREKVALFVIMVSCSVFFVGVFGFVPLLICHEDTIFSLQDIWLQTGQSWVVVHGWIYDVDDLINRHPGGVKGVVDYLGKDASRLFPRLPPVYLPEKCLDMAKVDAFDLNVYTPFNNFTNPTCQSFSELDILLGITCHTFMAGSKNTSKFIGDYTLASGELGVLSHTTVGLQGSGIDFIIMYDRVYDVTNYVKAIRENQEPTTEEDEGKKLDNNPQAYLTSTLNKVIMNSLGTDATELYEALFGSVEYIQCLEELFYVGVLDDEFDTFCYMLNMMMYSMIIFVALLMVIQFLASMVYICPRHRTYSEEDVVSPVMIMVPCYNEGDNELRKTIKSVLNTTYPDENKVLFMVADGLVTGNGEDMSTPEHLANILGFDIDEFEDDTFEYDCIGVVHTKNRARVYHGILQKGHKFLKYIAVVKCGLPEESTTSAKPGNRGKRDSQLVIMGYYNRIHYGRNLTELDSAIQRAMVDLNLQADMVRFMMAIDADTRVDTMSITHMVYGMDKKEKVLALCGETKVDNKASSWVTMIQVFEYYNSHHLKKAFEAAFGCVTCLPGCFTMYRIIADDGTPLLPGDGVLYEYSRNDIETLHEKNLYHLGEDRMLTTLLLKYYPDRSLTFIPEASCWTIVPHTFRILLSQRRRWINSTVHNMFELLKVDTMCGICCISMKVVVFIDLIATMILPASYIYAMYLIFLVMFEDLPVSVVLVILYGIIMGIQVVVFILRSRWEYVWWFFVYFTAGLPVFYLILPVYSFWNMDDFSWGKTRSVGGNTTAGFANPDDDDEDNDEADNDDDGFKRRSRGGYDNANDEDDSYTQDHFDRDEGSDEESDDDSDEENDSDDESDEENDSDEGNDSDEESNDEDDDSDEDDSDEDDESGYVSTGRA